jgi:DNA-directed RNA polymerase sigma subunit (sigma70/sigma32)
VGDELIQPDGPKSNAHLKLARRGSNFSGHCALSPGPMLEDLGDPERLISSRDAAISKRLQEQTRAVLETLSPREQQVLRLRFGITPVGGQALETMDEMLTPDQIAFIEAMALRKLRHPSEGVRLRSVDRR